jgi:hypothetical protein
MSITYLVPVLVVGATVYYFFVMRKRVMGQIIASGQGPMMFHNTFAKHFMSLAAYEYIIGIWQGVVYTGSRGLVGQLAGGLLNELSKSALGRTRYTPNVFVALTSNGRILVSEEYTEDGDRGNYKEIIAWGPGATAITGPSAIPEHKGAGPTNPFNPRVKLELAALVGPDGSKFEAWLSPQSSEMTGQQRPISAALPIAPADAAAVWENANRAAGAPRA